MIIRKKYPGFTVEFTGVGPLFHVGMVTDVRSIAYDFESRVGIVYMPENCCTHMTGAIEVFEQIDPKVRQVQTFAVDVPDTVYTRAAKEWTAR
jgi:hypothetical protein